jgi:hypothetical protein
LFTYVVSKVLIQVDVPVTFRTWISSKSTYWVLPEANLIHTFKLDICYNVHTWPQASSFTLHK